MPWAILFTTIKGPLRTPFSRRIRRTPCLPQYSTVYHIILVPLLFRLPSDTLVWCCPPSILSYSQAVVHVHVPSSLLACMLACLLACFSLCFVRLPVCRWPSSAGTCMINRRTIHGLGHRVSTVMYPSYVRSSQRAVYCYKIWLVPVCVCLLHSQHGHGRTGRDPCVITWREANRCIFFHSACLLEIFGRDKPLPPILYTFCCCATRVCHTTQYPHYTCPASETDTGNATFTSLKMIWHRTGAVQLNVKTPNHQRTSRSKDKLYRCVSLVYWQSHTAYSVHACHHCQEIEYSATPK